MSKILALIPARGGSKRIPGKNLRKIGGRTLIEHTVLSALNCRHVDKTIVSTDDLGIAKESKKLGAFVDWRSAELASDTAQTIDVVLDLLSREPNYDFILVLQPTSPLRTAADISNSISILHEKQADAVISVAKTDPPPHWSGAIGSDLSIANFISTKALVRSQDLEDFYHLNGAIYLNRIERLYEEKTFLFRSNSYAYIMPRERSVDIDEEIDLIIAEAIYSHSQKQ